MIHEKDLSRYYDLKDNVTAPVGTRIFEEEDWNWLLTRLHDSETTALAKGASIATLAVGIQGLSCLACVWLVEKIYEDQSGSVEISLDVRQAQLKLTWKPGQLDILSFAHDLKSLGYILSPKVRTDQRQESRSLGLKLGLCAAFAMNTMLASLPPYLGMAHDYFLADTLLLVALLFSTLSLLVGGLYFIRRAWSSLQLRTIHMDLPIALGLVAAYIGSVAGWLLQRPDLIYFDFVSIFVLLMLFGRWLQESVLEHNRSRYLDRHDVRTHVKRLENDAHSLQPIELIASGQRLLISPNEMIPVASRLEFGHAVLNMQCINGEQETRELKPGELLPSGGLHCGREELVIHALESWTDSLLYRLVANRENIYKNALLDTILRYYLSTVMALALIGACIWWWNTNIVTALQVAISVLVVSCPCAIGVALPLLNEMLIVGIRRRGIYIRNEGIWNQLRRIKCLVFDKTGTLTFEKPSLNNPAILHSLDTTALSILSQMVQSSLHPLCRSLNQTLIERHHGIPRLPDIGNGIQEIPGSGLLWQRNDGLWALGKPGWQSPMSEDFELNFSCDGKVLAGFQFSEKLRESSRTLAENLIQSGYQLHILSGDREEKVRKLADDLALPRTCALARQSPDDKANWVRQQPPTTVLMVGDGLNDSLALSSASCCGVLVTDLNVLGHKADFLIMGSAMRGVADLLEFAKVRQRSVHILFIFNILYNASVVTVALFGMMNPLIAAIVMPLSSVASTLLAVLSIRGRSIL